MSGTKQRVMIDAKSFQEPLAKLADTMVEKVFREGTGQCGRPTGVSDDIATMLRYAKSVCSVLFYLNADVRRKGDTDWRIHYGVTAMSLVRSLIDCLYNVTIILEDPATKGAEYRKSGIKRALNDLEEVFQAYVGQPEWDEWLKQRRDALNGLIRMSGFTVADIMNQPMWPTLGAYLRTQPQQHFLKIFTYLEWRQYSALSHGAYEAFIGPIGTLPTTLPIFCRMTFGQRWMRHTIYSGRSTSDGRQQYCCR